VGFFQPLFPGRRARAYVGALAALQDCLGAVNDAVVGRQIMRDIVSPMASQETPAEKPALGLERAIGLVIGWQVRGIETQRQALEQLWPAFASARKFWRRPRE
jgi:CHAD domain-containing protein